MKYLVIGGSKSGKSKVSEDIEVSLSSGIEALPSYIDTLVIAGMGGDLIIDIINIERPIYCHQ